MDSGETKKKATVVTALPSVSTSTSSTNTNANANTNTNTTAPPLSPSPLPKHSQNKITFGTCGWSDSGAPWNQSSSKRSSNAIDGRLHKYSHQFNFGCVEVDSTCYNIFPFETIQKWINSTPNTFIFHVKIFGFLAARGGRLRSLPKSVRSELLLSRQKQQQQQQHGESSSPALAENGSEYIRLENLPAKTIDDLWDMFNNQLQPFVTKNRLGCVLCQFHTSFFPNEQNALYVRQIRQRLRSDVRLAVEFRNRLWFDEMNIQDNGNNGVGTTADMGSASGSKSSRLGETIHLLKQLNIALVASDDLLHEVKQRDKNQQGLPPGEERIRLPPIMAPKCCQNMFYCRVHRRHGTDRLFRTEEVNDWVSKLENILMFKEEKYGSNDHNTEQPQTQLSKCNNLSVYFLIGTDYQDQPIQNMKLLSDHGGLSKKGLVLNWLDVVKQQALTKHGSLFSMGFAHKNSKKKDKNSLEKRKNAVISKKNTSSTLLAYTSSNKSKKYTPNAMEDNAKGKCDAPKRKISTMLSQYVVSSEPSPKKQNGGIESFFQVKKK